MAVAGPLDPRVFTVSTLGMVRDDYARGIMKNLEARANRIARLRGWTVGHLKEFYPRDRRLLGLNVSRGAEVCIRFRQHGAPHEFLPLEVIIGTLLHELCHCRISPHNHAFWQLHQTLVHEEEAWELRVATERSAAQHGASDIRRPSRTPATSAGDGGPMKPFSGAGYILGGGGAAVCGTRMNGGNSSRPLRDIVAEATMRRLAAPPPLSSAPAENSRAADPPLATRLSRSHQLQDSEQAEGCSQSVVGHRSKRERTAADGDDPLSSQHGWQCPRCSFINHEHLFPVCEICSDDIPLSSLQSCGANQPLQPPTFSSGAERERNDDVLVLASDSDVECGSGSSSDSDVVFIG